MTSIHTPAVESLPLRRAALAGKTVLVTGSGRGIGREVARSFALCGARVVIAEISAAGRETEGLIREAGGEALFVQTDVSNPEEVAWLARRAQGAFGPVEILINNAILCPVTSVLDMEVEQWDRVMAVNLRGTFLTCKACLPGMLALGRGVIVNMISTDAMPNLSAYIASKAGIGAFSASLAGEVGGQGVQVIAFAPGFVDTPGLRSAARGLAAQFGLTEEQFMRLPVHPAYADRAMPADHAAAATVFLVSELAEEYHGEVVNGYTVLERAGLIPTGEVSLQTASFGVVQAVGSATPEAARSEGPEPEAAREARELAAEFAQMIAATGEEFNGLPVFFRPMARAGFKAKSGASLQEWAHTAQALCLRLENLDEARAGERAAIGGPILTPQLKDRLGRLVVYFQQAPAETSRFVKDPQVMAQVTQISERRVKTIQDLVRVLESLAGA